MEMTHEDIVASYRQAKNKSTQIGVLADLNLTDKESIRAVLIDAGELPPDKAEKKPLPESNEDIATVIRESLEAGLTQTETAKLAGVCQATVGRYAREHGLGKRKKKQAEPASAQAPVQEGPLPDTKLPPDTVSKLDTGKPGQVYGRIESILGALPENADEYAKDCALNLCLQLLRCDLLQRLSINR